MSEVHRHGHTKRIGEPGKDLWQCQAPECLDVGPFLELMARECKRRTTITKDEHVAFILDNSPIKTITSPLEQRAITHIIRLGLTQ